MKQTTAVAISGGVDSLMAACLLQENGHNVIGVHFITGFENTSADALEQKTVKQPDILDIGKQLDIPVEIVDLRAEFREKIVAYFTRTYQSGKTPNPCMLCNPTIKFGMILDYARALGAQKLATGHYARIKKDEDGNIHLLKGLDRLKDQSYFLSRLSRRQLANAHFPLGEMQKSDVKQMAAQKGLHPVTRSESQDICFIKHDSYPRFLTAQTSFKPEPGLIEDVNGAVIGEHNGLHLFTVGQRRGINCPAAQPYYVVRLDTARNRLIVGSQKDLLSSSCRVTDINWIVDGPVTPLEVHTRLRYRSKETPSTVIPQNEHTALVQFNRPQSAVTPGQGAVFYRGDEILGGGWIAESKDVEI